MSDLQTIQHDRAVKQRELSRIGREIARLERDRARVIAEIVDLVEAERRRTRPDDLLPVFTSPFGNDGAA